VLEHVYEIVLFSQITTTAESPCHCKSEVLLLSNKFSDYRLKFYSAFNLFRTSGKSDMFSFDVLLVFRVSVLDTSRMYHLHDLAYYKYHYADLLVFSAKIFA